MPPLLPSSCEEFRARRVATPPPLPNSCEDSRCRRHPARGRRRGRKSSARVGVADPRRSAENLSLAVLPRVLNGPPRASRGGPLFRCGLVQRAFHQWAGDLRRGRHNQHGKASSIFAVPLACAHEWLAFVCIEPRCPSQARIASEAQPSAQNRPTPATEWWAPSKCNAESLRRQHRPARPPSSSPRAPADHATRHRVGPRRYRHRGSGVASGVV